MARGESPSITLDNFSGGMQGPRGQLRSNSIKNSFQHAENFLVERDGSLRNRPASNPLGVPTLPNDKVLLFDFRGQTYTIVYDPLYVMEFESTSAITAAELVNPPGPNISLGANKQVNQAHVPTLLDFLDRAFRADDVFGYDQEYPTIPDPLPSPVPSSLVADIRAWADSIVAFDFTDDDALYNLYQRLYLFRARAFAEKMYWISVDETMWRSTSFSNSDTSPQILNKIRGYCKKVSLSRHSLYWSRFLIYDPNGDLVHNGITRCAPDGFNAKGEVPSVIRPTGVEAYAKGDDGIPAYRKGFTGDYGRYLADVSINTVILSDPLGILPSLIIDLNNLHANREVTVFDMKATFNRGNWWYMPSYLTREEFSLYARKFGNVSSGGLIGWTRYSSNPPGGGAPEPITDADWDFLRDTYPNNLLTSINAAQTSRAVQATVTDNNPANGMFVGNSESVVKTPDEVGMKWRVSGNAFPESINSALLRRTKGFNMSATPFFDGNPLVRWVKLAPISIFRPIGDLHYGQYVLENYPQVAWFDTRDGANPEHFRALEGNCLTYVVSEYGLLLGDSGVSSEAGESSRSYFFGRYGLYPLPFTPLLQLDTDSNTVAGRSSYSRLTSNPGRDDRHHNVFPWIDAVKSFGSRFEIRNYVHRVIPSAIKGAAWNEGDYAKFATVAFGRAAFAGFDSEKGTLMVTSTLFSARNINFNHYDNLIGSTTDPLVNKGFARVMTAERGIIIRWMEQLDGVLRIGTQRGVVSITGNYTRLTVANATATYEESAANIPPVSLFTMNYQVLNDLRTVFLIQKSTEIPQTCLLYTSPSPRD